MKLQSAGLTEALAHTPVVLLHGPHQCGKTTLSRSVAEPAGYGYLAFDDDTLVAAAGILLASISAVALNLYFNGARGDGSDAVEAAKQADAH